MPTRTLSILALGAGLALTTAACSGTGDASASGAPTTVAAPTTAATTAAASPTTAAATITAAPTATSGSTASPVAPARQPCPVTGAALRAAMKADKGGAIVLKYGATLGKPDCYAGYVLVTQRSVKDANGDPVADDEVATFKYESGSWKYQGASSADYCEGMPTATRKHFVSHFDGGCGG